MTFYRESREGIDPIWEYCRQQQQRNLERRIRNRQLKFLLAWSVLGVIITSLVMYWK